MAKITMQEQEEYPVLPAESIIHVKVTDAVVREMQGGRSGSWEKLDFKFKILGIQVAGDGGPIERFDNIITSEIYGGVPFRLTDHPENKLRMWVEAILGMSLGLGFELDTEYLVNRECRAITRVYDKKATDSQGRPYQGHGVETLLAKAGASTTANPNWGQPGAQQQPMNQGTQQGWGAPQQPTQQPVQDPWAADAARDPWGGQPAQQQQPAMTGWGNAGTDDPPF